ncbi:MAG: hypothetical protein L6V93_21720 [Clostridiales bacterium]|nr:MAG: hypothetical protein L6V93_21720 [Clostridiales bacterium]
MLKNYSVTAMAENTITAYKKVLREKANGYDFYDFGIFRLQQFGRRRAFCRLCSTTSKALTKM